VKAERKQKVIRIRNAWVNLIKQYQAPKDASVSWENILKVLVYLIADKKEVKTYKEIAAELGVDEKTVERAVKALDGIDFGDVTITRKLAWFKNQKDEYKVKGQRIDVGLDFSAGSK
jgi:methylphosphotriester-DNA--protein-cysteine methyltransferase